MCDIERNRIILDQIFTKILNYELSYFFAFYVPVFENSTKIIIIITCSSIFVNFLNFLQGAVLMEKETKTERPAGELLTSVNQK